MLSHFLKFLTFFSHFLKVTHTDGSVRFTHKSLEKCPAKNLTHVRTCLLKKRAKQFLSKKIKISIIQTFFENVSFPATSCRMAATSVLSCNKKDLKCVVRRCRCRLWSVSMDSHVQYTSLSFYSTIIKLTL